MFLRHIKVRLVLLIAVLMSPATALGMGPENVLLVVNSKSESSLTIANHYIQLRGIPAKNVLYLENVDDSKVLLHMVAFKKRILEPIFEFIDQNNLKIDCVVYSSGFPTAIALNDDYKLMTQKLKNELGPEKAKQMFKFFASKASITSLTFFGVQHLNKDIRYFGLNANRCYRGPVNNTAIENQVLGKLFVGQQQKDFEAIVRLANTQRQSAIQQLLKLSKENPRQAALNYWLVRAYAAGGDVENALVHLQLAIDNGWCFQEFTKSDRYLKKVSKHAEFLKAVANIKNENFLPTLSFDSRNHFSENGFPNGASSEGDRYVMSCMLGVTLPRGCTDEQVIASLTASVKADRTNPQGTFYFTSTSDVRTKTRLANAKAVIKKLTAMGHQAELVNGAMPSNKSDVLGLTSGSAKFDWKKTNSQILPGAFCDNLTSAGAAFEHPGQTKLTEFLSHRAAGASGTVIEPYALQQKFPHPMIHVHYVRGANLVESFYQSVSGPFQILLVGDPLCTPFTKAPEFSVTGVEPNSTVGGLLEFNVDVSSALGELSRLQIYLDSELVVEENISMKRTIRLDSKGLAEGFHEIRIRCFSKSAVAVQSEKILKFNVDNTADEINLSASRVDYEKNATVALRATVKGAAGPIKLYQGTRELAQLSTNPAFFRVPTWRLGTGPVRLHVEALDSNNQKMVSESVFLTVKN